jgi:hypothetical protein
MLPVAAKRSIEVGLSAGSTKFGLGKYSPSMSLEISTDVTDSPPKSFALEVTHSPFQLGVCWYHTRESNPCRP